MWDLSELTKVYCQRFFMKVWGHTTPKPTFVLSNTPQIGILHHGKCKRKDLEPQIKTTTRYESRDGKTRFKGNQYLKGTQFLV